MKNISLVLTLVSLVSSLCATAANAGAPCGCLMAKRGACLEIPRDDNLCENTAHECPSNMSGIYIDRLCPTETRIGTCVIGDGRYLIVRYYTRWDHANSISAQENCEKNFGGEWLPN